MRTTDPDRFMPQSHDEAARWAETRRRKRILDGEWRSDVEDALREHLAATRVANLGRPVLAVNLLRSVCSQLAVLYDRPATIHIGDSDPDTEDRFSDLLADIGAWSILQRHAEYVIGLRESLILVGWSESESRPTLELVTPDQVIVEHRDGDPCEIVKVKHARVRTSVIDGQERPVVCWDVYDLTDQTAPSFRIEAVDGTDVTQIHAPDDVGRYPWQDDEGPWIPLTLYHAQDVGRLWDPHGWSEIVEGTLDCAVLWSLFFHCARDASWRQKYAIDLQVGGTKLTDAGAGETARSVETSPSSIILFRTMGDKSGSAGTFEAPTDPGKFAESNQRFQQTVVSHIGVHPADLERQESASSGYAIQLKRSSQRKLGMKFEGQFRRGDLQLFRTIARTANLFGGESFPVDGFQITYHPIEETVAEMKDDLEYQLMLVDSNLLSRVELYKRLNPGVTDEMAIRNLIEIEAVNRGIPEQAEEIMRQIGAETMTVDDMIDESEEEPGDDAENEIPPMMEEIPNE